MKQSIDEVKKIFSDVPITDVMSIIKKFKNDDRKGVQKIIKQYQKKYSDFFDEKKRIDNISFYEKKYYEKGIKFIGGIDEVGRGPLAGPVVAAVVILPQNCRILGINYYKKLSEKKKKRAFL